MIIDGHAHACGDFLHAENIVQKLDTLGVEKVVLVPGEINSEKNYSLINFANMFPDKNVVKITNRLTRFVIKITGSINQIPNGNDYVFSLSQKTNGRVVQFLWITQKIKNLDIYLDQKFQDWSFKGLKLHQCWEKFSIHSDFFSIVAQWSENNNLPLFIHLYSDKDVIDIINYKKNHPKLKLIIAHLFGIEIFIKHEFKDDNLFFDVSPYQLNSTARLLKAIDFIGTRNIIMGSDTPYGKKSLEKNIERIRKLNIKDEEFILGRNIEKLLNLKN
jgi:predicted TIM-barrel fold metal-dependent hydrolase